MKSTRIFIFIALIRFSVAATVTYGQSSKQVTGKVINATTNEALPGVNIVELGTQNGTFTDSQGNFNLMVQSMQDSLSFTYVGYQNKTVAINGRNAVNVSLNLEALQGQEMVVVGYGRQKKTDLTGSVATIDVDSLSQGVVA